MEKAAQKSGGVSLEEFRNSGDVHLGTGLSGHGSAVGLNNISGLFHPKSIYGNRGADDDKC